MALLFAQIAYAKPLIALTSPTGVAYLSGGIGEEEVLAMRAQAKKFTLNLLFSEGTSGRWVTNVNVNIYNEQDERVFRIVGSKPMLYVNLPTGTYLILANNNGQKLRHKVSLEDNANKKVILNWKDAVEEDLSADE
ncbi:MAG: hypothetical protein BVN34_01710 [Proteobacteria bacterium ST_bin12]|nr:MAG: hypothetical protein BVN34_01710 [Proteobacteria bacterium ST_bin12]